MDAAVVAGRGLGTLGLLLDVVDRETAAGLLELADDVAPGRVGCWEGRTARVSDGESCEVVRKGEIWCSAAMPESAVQTSAETVATRAGWTLTVATPVSHTLDHFSS